MKVDPTWFVLNHRKKNGKDERPYRLDVRLPRAVSERLEFLVHDIKKQQVKVSKSEVVAIILEDFFDRAE